MSPMTCQGDMGTCMSAWLILVVFSHELMDSQINYKMCLIGKSKPLAEGSCRYASRFVSMVEWDVTTDVFEIDSTKIFNDVRDRGVSPRKKTFSQKHSESAWSFRNLTILVNSASAGGSKINQEEIAVAANIYREPRERGKLNVKCFSLGFQLSSCHTVNIPSRHFWDHRGWKSGLSIVIPSRASGRGYKIGPVCVSVCLWALSRLNRLTYTPNIWWRHWTW